MDNTECLKPTEELINEFLNLLDVQRALSKNTISSYQSQLRAYSRFLNLKNLNATIVASETINEYLVIKMNQGCKASSRFITTIAIKKFYEYLLSTHAIKTNPANALELPKYKQLIPDPLSVEEIETLINRADGNRFSLVRLKTMLEVLYTTGIRVSELINLQLSQIDLKNDWIRVLGKGNKTRDVPIGSKAKEALNFYFDMRAKRFGVESDFVFLNSRGSKITRGGFWKQLKNLGKSASINGRVHPHRIRHSTACHLLSNGANLRVIQELYGHASITTTQRYSQVTPQFLKSSVKAAHPRF